jgi:uncharacterized protein YaaN involved in tellurite resistance
MRDALAPDAGRSALPTDQSFQRSRRALAGERTGEKRSAPSMSDDPNLPTATVPNGPSDAATAGLAVEPPEAPGTGLVLVPPTAVAIVAPEQATRAVPVAPEVAGKLQATVEAYVADLLNTDVHAPSFTQKVQSISSMGDKDIRETSNVSNRLLDRPTKSLNATALGKDSQVATGLTELRRTVESLDPSRYNLTGARKLLGLVPFGNKLRDYFQRYQSAQKQISGIIQSLYNGKDELLRDNADLAQEKINLWEAMSRLRQFAYMAELLDHELAAHIEQMRAQDPDRAKVLEQDVLFYVRQKHMDILTQLAVCTQGYLALDQIRKNNTELVKGVDRATTTTVAALRTAVIVAQALTTEKLVLDQIQAVNRTTSNLIESTSVMLRQQTERVHDQAASSSVELAKLQAAFTNIYATMDSIDSFKQRALLSMQTTVDALTVEVGKAQKYLERTQHAAADVPALSGNGPALLLPGKS